MQRCFPQICFAGPWLVAASLLSAVNAASASQINPTVTALWMTNHALGQLGRPPEQYRCSKCGTTYDHYVTKCAKCEADFRRQQEAAAKRRSEAIRKKREHDLRESSRKTQEHLRRQEAQIEKSRRKKSDDSNPSSGQTLGKLVRFAAAIISLIFITVGVYTASAKKKRRRRLSNLRGTSANPQLDFGQPPDGGDFDFDRTSGGETPGVQAVPAAASIEMQRADAASSPAPAANRPAAVRRPIPPARPQASADQPRRPPPRR